MSWQCCVLACGFESPRIDSFGFDFNFTRHFIVCESENKVADKLMASQEELFIHLFIHSLGRPRRRWVDNIRMDLWGEGGV